MEGEQKLKKKRRCSHILFVFCCCLWQSIMMCPSKGSVLLSPWPSETVMKHSNEQKKWHFPASPLWRWHCRADSSSVDSCLFCWSKGSPLLLPPPPAEQGKSWREAQTSDVKVPSMLGPSSYAGMKAIALIHTTHETRPWKSANDFPLFCREARLTWNDENHCVVFPQNMKRGHQIQPLRFFPANETRSPIQMSVECA